jgi:hypothetical protein
MRDEDAGTGAGRLREIVALATVEIRRYLGRTRSGVPRTKMPPDLDPARLEQEGVPGILLWPSVEEANPAAPRSRIGGYPNALPSGGWPMVEMPAEYREDGPAPMSFIAQVELAPLRHLHPQAEALPKAGALLFFLDEFLSAEGHNGDPYCRPCRVAHVPALDCAEGVRPPPLPSRGAWSHHEIVTGYLEPKPGFSPDCYPAATLTPAAGPTWRRPGFSDMPGISYRLSEALDNAAAQLNGVEPKAGTRPHMMFGVPATNMGRMDDLGDYPGILDYVPGAVPDPRIDYAAPPEDPWIVLLQVSSSVLRMRSGASEWQMKWMDVGYLGFFIRRSALEARNWSKVVAVLDG